MQYGTWRTCDCVVRTTGECAPPPPAPTRLPSWRERAQPTSVVASNRDVHQRVRKFETILKIRVKKWVLVQDVGQDKIRLSNLLRMLIQKVSIRADLRKTPFCNQTSNKSSIEEGTEDASCRVQRQECGRSSVFKENHPCSHSFKTQQHMQQRLKKTIKSARLIIFRHSGPPGIIGMENQPAAVCPCT